MTASGKSLFYFGIYAIIAGLLLIIIPSTIISLLQLPLISTGWARVVGLLSMVIGTYDMVCGKAGIQAFIKASVYVRLGFALGASLLLLFGQMPVTIFLLGIVDALGSLWTVIALRYEAIRK